MNEGGHIKKFTQVLLFALFLPEESQADESQFLGIWCTNPCLYAGSRSYHLPCKFEITEDHIKWEKPDRVNPSVTNYFSLTYELEEKASGTEVFLLTGTGGRNWYEPGIGETNSYQLVLTSEHDNVFVKESIFLKDRSYCADTNGWCGGGSMFITPFDDKCP